MLYQCAPRISHLERAPKTLGEWYDLACSDVYRDSGINAHLPYIKSLVKSNDVVVELGVGGGDQSTLAWLCGTPRAYIGYDLNTPSMIDTVRKLADDYDVSFHFFEGNTADAPVCGSDILMIDSLHDYVTVKVELYRFAPYCRRLICFHDTESFGKVGQSTEPNSGINCAIAEFLYRHKEWGVDDYRDFDNGFLTLRRLDECPQLTL